MHEPRSAASQLHPAKLEAENEVGDAEHDHDATDHESSLAPRALTLLRFLFTHELSPFERTTAVEPANNTLFSM